MRLEQRNLTTGSFYHEYLQALQEIVDDSLNLQHENKSWADESYIFQKHIDFLARMVDILESVEFENIEGVRLLTSIALEFVAHKKSS